jgi:hypothetical protein
MIIDQYGGLGAAKRLLAKPNIQEGLTKLWELGLLDQSMEALVIQERFEPCSQKRKSLKRNVDWKN